MKIRNIFGRCKYSGIKQKTLVKQNPKSNFWPFRPKIALLIIFAIGVAIRLFAFIITIFKLPISGDEGIMGLMATHILKGEFPIVYWGQPYMGTQEAYFDALFIFLFGVNAVSVRLCPLLLSILFMYLVYKLASKIYNHEVALISLLLLSIPFPYINVVTCCSLGNNLATVSLGTLALIIAYDLIYGQKVKRPILYYALLGLILGFAFWLQMLIIVYIIPIVFLLFLKDKLLIIRRNFWVFIVLFVIGSFPVLWYNLVNDFITFRVITSGVDKYKILENLKDFFHDTIHYILGTKVMLYCDTIHYIDLPRILSYILLSVLVSLIIITVVARFRKIWRVLLLSLKNTDGTIILITTALATVFTFCRTGRSNWWAARFILPLMTVLPVIFAYGLWRIKRFSKIIFYIAIFIILLANIWGNTLLIKAWCDPIVVNEKLELPGTKELIKFLKEKDIRYAYSTFWFSYRLTYETKEEIICSQPFNERYLSCKLPFIEKVQHADNVAYILHKKLGLKPEHFEEMLEKIGGGYKKQDMDELPATAGKLPTEFVVFYSFKPPYKKMELKCIPRNKWKVSSNYKPDDATKAIDGDLSTRWGSGAPQSTDMYFLIDLGSNYEISKIRFDLGGFITDFPRGYAVDVSADNNSWTTVARMDNVYGTFFWKGSHPWAFIERDFFNTAFPPVNARYIRITHLGSHPRFDWSIAEINIFGKKAD